MSHMRLLWLVLPGSLLLQATARAGAPGPSPSMFQKLAGARVVLVGEITAIEGRPVKTEYLPASRTTVEFVVAAVKVREALEGVKGLTHVRVGFLLPAPGRRDGWVLPAPALKKGQELLLYLTPHHRETFLVLPSPYHLVDAKGPFFAREVPWVRRALKLAADPLVGLKARDPEDRFLTAALLLFRYRSSSGPVRGPEPIPAEESRLILEAIAEADWAPRVAGPVPAQTLFYQLGVTEKDGWKQPADFRQFPVAAKRWLKDNANTYRIGRYVPLKPDH